MAGALVRTACICLVVAGCGSKIHQPLGNGAASDRRVPLGARAGTAIGSGEQGDGSNASGATGNATSGSGTNGTTGSSSTNSGSGKSSGSSSTSGSTNGGGSGGSTRGTAGNGSGSSSNSGQTRNEGSGGNGGSRGAGSPGPTPGAGGTSGTGGVTFVVPADAKPTPESSGIKGAFRVNTQTGHLTHDGQDFQVRGGNWFGLEGQDDLQRPGAMELYIGAVSWASESDKRDIQTTMKEVKAAPLALNTVRFPVAPQTLVKGHPDGDYTRTDVKIRNNDSTKYPYSDANEAFEDFVKQADQNGLYLILDMHSCSNHVGWRAGKIDDGPPWVDANRESYQYKKEDKTCKTGEDAYDKEKWLADIHTLAKLPAKLGVKNILGIDCFNEPWKYSWSEWADLAKECYDAVAAESDDLIVVVEGVSSSHEQADGTLAPEPYGDAAANPNWGENLYGQQFDPIQIPKDRLCFSPHTYGPAVYVQKQFIDQSDPACVGLEDDAAGKAKCKLVVERTNADAVALIRKGWEQHFGYLIDQGFCVLPGEFGGYKDWPNNPVKPTAQQTWSHLPTSVRYDWEWQNMLVDYLKEKGITDFLYWSINPESGDTGGLYNHAFSQSNQSGWGVWKGLDTEKANMLGGLQ